MQITMEYYSIIYCSILSYGTPYHGMVPRYTMVLYQGIPWSCYKCAFSHWQSDTLNCTCVVLCAVVIYGFAQVML